MQCGQTKTVKHKRTGENKQMGIQFPLNMFSSCNQPDVILSSISEYDEISSFRDTLCVYVCVFMCVLVLQFAAGPRYYTGTQTPSCFYICVVTELKPACKRLCTSLCVLLFVLIFQAHCSRKQSLAVKACAHIQQEVLPQLFF